MSVIKQLDAKGAVVIPREMREGVEVVEIERRADGVIELRPKHLVDAAQAWFWTDRWQRMEREADADVAAGRVVPFEDVEAFLGDLDGG